MFLIYVTFVLNIKIVLISPKELNCFSNITNIMIIVVNINLLILL